MGRIDRGQSPIRMIGLGVEFAAIVLASMYCGSLADRYWLNTSTPWGLLGLSLAGFLLAIVRLVVKSRQWL